MPRRQRPDRWDPPKEATEGATAAGTMRPVPVDRCQDPWGIVVVHCTARAKLLGTPFPWEGAHRWVAGGDGNSDSDRGGPGLPAGAVAAVWLL